MPKQTFKGDEFMTRNQRSAIDRLFDLVLAEREANKARGRYSMAVRWEHAPDEVARLAEKYQAAKANLEMLRAEA